jgi:hypothetical protein
MKQTYYAVMQIKSSLNFNQVNLRASSVATKLIENADVFTSPAIDPTRLQEENGKLEKYMGLAKGNSEMMAKRNEQSKLVHGMLKELTPYVNGVAKGVKSIILLSGFPASTEPTPNPAPEAVIIKRIVPGPTANTAKLYVVAQKVANSYIVQTSNTLADANSFKTVLVSTSSRKLIISNTVRGQEIFIRVAANNANGDGQWSNITPYLGQ